MNVEVVTLDQFLGQCVMLLICSVILVVRLVECLIEGLVEHVVRRVAELEERVARVLLSVLRVRADPVLHRVVDLIRCLLLVGGPARVAVFAKHPRLLQFFDVA